MEPIPETVAALVELEASGARSIRDELALRARLVRSFVPDCVGMSLASVQHGVTFTLVATSEEIAVLDAVQYLSGGPCVDAAHTDEVWEFTGDDEALLDEAGWHRFARATAAHSIASTLSLPILDDGDVVGTVNLYAASAQAFTGLHDEVAVIFGAWAPGAITNADLSFSTRETAQEAPQMLQDSATVDRAVRMLAAAADLTDEEARASLHDAARRAGTTAVRLAETLFRSQHDPDGEA